MLQGSHTGKQRTQSGGGGTEVGAGGGQMRARDFSGVSTGKSRQSRVSRSRLASLDHFISRLPS